MRMNVFEMEGFLRGRCVPRDLKVNETDAEYLVRKFDALEAKCVAYSALFDHGLASKSDQRFAYIRSTGNLTFSTAF